jgi:hypothetical protein
LIVPAFVITNASNGIYLRRTPRSEKVTKGNRENARTKTSSHPPSSRVKYSRCCHRSSFVGPSVWMLAKYEPRVRGWPAARTRRARKRWFDTSSVSSPNNVGRNYIYAINLMRDAFVSLPTYKVTVICPLKGEEGGGG